MENDNDFVKDKEVLLTMINEIEHRFIEMGQMLSEMKSKKVYKKLGYISFKEFADNELDIPTSLINKLVNNYNFYVGKMDLDDNTLIEIGLEKLQLMRSFIKDMDENDRDHWIKKALTEKDSDFREELKEAKERKKRKLKTSKDILIEQFVERMVTELNINQKELMFEIALYFQDENLDDFEHKVMIKKERFRDGG